MSWSLCKQTRSSGMQPPLWAGIIHGLVQHWQGADAQVKARVLRPDHPIVQANQRLREELLPPEHGEPQHEKGLFAAKVRVCHSVCHSISLVMLVLAPQLKQAGTLTASKRWQ